MEIQFHGELANCFLGYLQLFLHGILATGFQPFTGCNEKSCFPRFNVRH